MNIVSILKFKFKRKRQNNVEPDYFDVKLWKKKYIHDTIDANRGEVGCTKASWVLLWIKK